MAQVSTDLHWGALRCPTCERFRANQRGIADARGEQPDWTDYRYKSRILCRYVIGSLSTSGRIEVRCMSCKTYCTVTFENQHGDGVQTFEWVQSRPRATA